MCVRGDLWLTCHGDFARETSLDDSEASHYFSHMSLLKTIKQLWTAIGNIYIQKPGGFWADLTDWTNLFGG